ncbi:siderophore-interacting protein [Thalassotalea piscium]
MKPRKPNIRLTHVLKIIDLSPHLRRIVFTGDSLHGFPVGFEGGYVKVVINPTDPSQLKMRSYTIRSFDSDLLELTLDFVINRHEGPATNWALSAKIGDSVGIAGPGPMKLTDYNHHSNLLVGDLTSINAINGYMPRFKKDADSKAILSVPTRADIIELDYDESLNTKWFVEDEEKGSLEDLVIATAQTMSKDTYVFMAVEAGVIKNVRPVLTEEIGIDRLNVLAVGYWKKGVDAERFGEQKKAGLLSA